MSILVPLVLAVLFLILQMILYAHDAVWADAWICTRNQETRWQLEHGQLEHGQLECGQLEHGMEEETLFAAMPRLVVLRQETVDQTEGKDRVTTQATFRFCLLPDMVSTLISGYPAKVERRVTDRMQDLPGWVRKAGVISN